MPTEGIVLLDFERAEEIYTRRGRKDDSPDALFDRVWAFTLLDQTLEGLRDEYSRAGKLHLFQTLSPCLTSDVKLSYQSVAAELQMSEGAVRVAVHRLKQRYGTILRRQIAETVRNESDVDEELDELMKAIG